MIRRVTIEAPAKINLRLAVLARETTGFHSLESLFCGISLADRLEVEASDPGVRIEVAGSPELGPPENNLVVRAAHRFHQALGTLPAVRVRLEKSIPVAAGLGGGSSDAASMLRALNYMHDFPLSDAALLALGADLGSDVAFFLTSTPFALGWGRGERLLELDPLPSRPLLLVDPGVPLPTASAFDRLDQLRGDQSPATAHALVRDALSSWETLEPFALNDFELVALERIPGLPHALRALLHSGARIALLAGSGSSAFGIFPAAEYLDQAAENLRGIGFQSRRADTLTAWPSPSAGIDPPPVNG